jgi:hypothetical protein
MTWALCVFGVVMAVALGIPLFERLSRLIWRPGPREEEVRKSVERARRRADHIPF